MKFMRKATPGQQYTLEEIRKLQTGNVKRGGIGCSVIAFFCGGVWLMAGIGSLTLGTALNFLGGILIVALALGALYLGWVIHRNRKQQAAIDVRLSVQLCRCVKTWEDDDGESSCSYAAFENSAGSRWETSIYQSEQEPLTNREGWLVLDEAHRELVMFFPRDLWQYTSQGFVAR